MPETVRLTPLAIATDGNAAPDWVMLFPAGETIPARDGRSFSLSAAGAQALIDHFKADGKDLYVDYEHATQERAPKGLSAPAVGWIVDLDYRDGALWARVDWTDAGRAALTAREYRYISPSFYHDDDGSVVALDGAGLTNQPAFRLPAVARAAANTETLMDKELLEALGLKPDATEADVKTATLAIAKKAKDAEAATEAAEAELATARAEGGTTPDPTRFVPRSDYEAATARIDALEAAETDRTKAAEEAAVDAAIQGGKATPGSRDYHLAACRTMGVAKFREYMAGQPRIAAASVQVTVEKAADGKGRGTTTLTEEELAVARQFGRTPEEAAKMKEAEQ